MPDRFIESFSLAEFYLWQKMKDAKACISFEMEITARCNNNCRHCYINLPAGDIEARKRELSFEETKGMIDQAADLGAVWCLLTGGEPLLKEDFFDIYLYLKEKGLLVSVFTNATLITDKHIELFTEYPPRDIEVTVYGITKKTYERISRIPGSYEAFMRGLDLLLKNKIKVRFKAMALRSNVNELPGIAQFCRERTKDHFRFDPFLHLRFDRNRERNEEIKSERLTSQEIVTIERADNERFTALEKNCDKLVMSEVENTNCDHLFHCGAGKGSFSVSYDGIFRLCSSLWHPGCVYDLKKGNLAEVWRKLIPKVRDMRSAHKGFLKRCRTCPIINLCIWCPAHAYLETGELDTPVEYFCEVAHARAESLERTVNSIR